MEKPIYESFNYELKTIMPDETKTGIFNFFKSHKEEEVLTFIDWLQEEQPQFLFSYRDFIFPRLLDLGHFNVANKILQSKTLTFDEKIATSCCFMLSLDWKQDFFDYFLDKLNKIDSKDQFSIIKCFWSEFLQFQFQRNDEVESNMQNVIYVFDKIPFYQKSDCDLKNGYLIKARKSFFNKGLFNLSVNNQIKVIQQIAYLCGEYYSDFYETFKEEFEHFPEAINIVDKFILTKNLDKELNSVNTEKKKVKV